jgi:preprotein translocase subunit YajC
MQNLKEGDNVVINSTGVVGKIIRMDYYNYVVEDENGTIHACRHDNVTKRQFLTEIENDGEDIL